MYSDVARCAKLFGAAIACAAAEAYCSADSSMIVRPCDFLLCVCFMLHTCRAWRRLCTLAWPLAGADLLTFLKELIITSYVGHMGAGQLSAFVLGQAVYNISGATP